MQADKLVKICGINSIDARDAAHAAGANYLGFVFFEKSPRHVSLEMAATLLADCPVGICKVALCVNASDAALAAITALPFDMLQLHGAESPARVQEIKTQFGLPVMKAIGVAQKSDFDRLADYADIVDQFLIDAKAPKGAKLPGGNGLAFDWQLLAGRYFPKPWMLAGGLTPQNVAQAIGRTGAKQVDVSSGVESAPGVKDAGKISAFVKAAHHSAPLLG